MSPRPAVLLVLAAFVLAGCGATAVPVAKKTKARAACRAHRHRSLVTRRNGFAVVVPRGAVAHERPGGRVLARFGPKNANGAPTVFGVLGSVVTPYCEPTWFRVQLPLRPNGITGYVRASDVRLLEVPTRIEVDISQRRITLYRRGRPVLHATAAVGSAATPTPTGRYYVNQRLLTNDPSGPYGPGAIGISAYSNVLTGWTQGGPIAIHGTNQPSSIGQPVSNGCLRLPNAVLRRLFAATVTGTPVVIHP
ncbi:MAG TPA: L,D-transpeptidase [Gaiellaceae bacterium]|jgi:lipoprotein-anchoring transpeptidase ErfK/SrfK